MTDFAAEPPLLSVRDLGIRLSTSRGTVRAADGVCFDLAAGKTLGIVGESGCGKSLLCRSLIRLLPGAGWLLPGSRIVFAGLDLARASERELNRVRGREVAMVFQNPMGALNPVWKVGRQIAENLTRHRRVPRRGLRAETVGLLHAVGIPAPERTAEAYPHQLSGGMRQRVVLAIAVAGRPRLLIADEPTTALDVTVQAQILALLDDLRAELGMALLLVSHNLGVVASHADEVAVMYAGHLVEHAAAPDLFRRPRHPYTRALLDAVPRLDPPSRAPLGCLEGGPPDLREPPLGCRFAPRCPRAAPPCLDAAPPLAPGPEGCHPTACWFPLWGAPP